MLSFHVKFVQTDRQTDRWTTVKQYALDISMRGHKKYHLNNLDLHYEQKSLEGVFL